MPRGRQSDANEDIFDEDDEEDDTDNTTDTSAVEISKDEHQHLQDMLDGYINLIQELGDAAKDEFDELVTDDKGTEEYQSERDAAQEIVEEEIRNQSKFSYTRG